MNSIYFFHEIILREREEQENGPTRDNGEYCGGFSMWRWLSIKDLWLLSITHPLKYIFNNILFVYLEQEQTRQR